MSKKPNRQDIIIAGLLRLGYAQDQDGRSTHYKEFHPGPETMGFLSLTPSSGPGGTAPHRILVGPRSVRYTLTTIAQSRPLPVRYMTRLTQPQEETR